MQAYVHGAEEVAQGEDGGGVGWEGEPGRGESRQLIPFRGLKRQSKAREMLGP